MVIEEAIVQAVIAPHRRERWLQCLGSSERRAAFLDRLNHCSDLDPRYTRSVAADADGVGLLRSLGAPGICYLLSAAAELDGREMTLAEAIVAVERAGWGTLVGCIPGRPGYYFDECGERRMLLVR
jgi:hypothetical protein